jgi:YegS/Rv2252/BmrU family lipid kinase
MACIISEEIFMLQSVKGICSGAKKLRVFCIINDHAGSAGASPKISIEELFRKHGLKAKIVAPTDTNSISALAKGAIQKDYDVIIAGGGDGTVNAVASALVGNKATKLGILPMGTLNHFARDLGIPIDMEKAVETIVAGHVKSIDVGEVNGKIFINNSGLGLYPAMVRLREGLQKSGHIKFLAAIWASIRIFARFRRLHLELRPPSGVVVKRKTPMLFVGNNPYDTSLSTLGARSSIDMGLLWVVMPIVSSRWGLVRSLWAVLWGSRKTGDVYTIHTAHLVVASRRRLLKVAVDGEVMHLKPPLNFRIRPKSLQVIVPADQTHG